MNSKRADVLVVTSGGATVMSVCGGRRSPPPPSITHARTAGSGSTLPTSSMALTSNRWMPSSRPEYDAGEPHALQSSSSRRHSNSAGSSAWNVSVAPPTLTIPGGPASIVVSGGTASVRHVREAGVGSALPAGSTARTLSVRVPTNSVTRYGVGHGCHSADVSNRHSKLEPGSEARNVQPANVVHDTGPGPLAIVVSGGVTSASGWKLHASVTGPFWALTPSGE